MWWCCWWHIFNWNNDRITEDFDWLNNNIVYENTTFCVLWFNTGRNALFEHYTRNSMHKMWIFTILKPYFQHKMWDDSRFRWQTGTYGCEASSFQVKSEFAYQNWQVISVVKVRLFHDLQWLLLVATINVWNLNISSLCNAWRTGLDTSSDTEQ